MKKVMQTGFTLLELLMAMAILGVIAGIAVPSMSAILEANRTEATIQSFYTYMVSARSEAVARNQNAIMCKSPTGVFCASTGNWEQGWLTYIDEDGDGVKDITDPITASYNAIPSNYTLRTGASFNTNMVFLPDGSLSQVGTFRLCGPDADTTHARSVVINITGRPRASDGAAVCP